MAGFPLKHMVRFDNGIMDHISSNINLSPHFQGLSRKDPIAPYSHPTQTAVSSDTIKQAFLSSGSISPRESPVYIGHLPRQSGIWASEKRPSMIRGLDTMILSTISTHRRPQKSGFATQNALSPAP